jgi:glucan 1,3-beta-glucosidase
MLKTAKGGGHTDDWQAITYAIIDGHRCGSDCNATSTKGAIIYFPPGAYLNSKPIVQYYFTVFFGHSVDNPTILGGKDFEGIFLIDTDIYILGGWGTR